MTKNEKLQAVFHLYATEHGYEPATVREAVTWGVEQGMLTKPKNVDPLDILAAQMASAPGQEYDTYEGRRYRVNHAVRTTKLNNDVTVYNHMNSGERPEIQMVLNFTNDVAERLTQG